MSSYNIYFSEEIRKKCRYFLNEQSALSGPMLFEHLKEEINVLAVLNGSNFS